MSYKKYGKFVIPDMFGIFSYVSKEKKLSYIKHNRKCKSCSGIDAECCGINCSECILGMDNYDIVTRILKMNDAKDIDIKKEFKL